VKPVMLTKRIQELSEKLKPLPSKGIRFDFYSFTEPEQLVILKNQELEEKYGGKWTHELIIENKDIVLKLNHILVSRMIELFEFAMPKAMMLDELEESFFKFNFHDFFRRWFECQKKLERWSEKDRQDFLRDIKPKPEKKNKSEGVKDGEENHN
jgi:hypothetical protein